MWRIMVAANLATLTYLAFRVPQADALVVLLAVVALDVVAFFWNVTKAAASLRRGGRGRHARAPEPGNGDDPAVPIYLEPWEHRSPSHG